MTCPTSWCDQHDREHFRHESTPLTLFGEGWTDPGSASVQLVVSGLDDDDTTPMIAIVGKAERQIDVMLTWQDAHDLATEILRQHRTFARLQVPQ